eukprot:1179586-Prorocentrum_minimum.AAC.1
MNTGLPNTGLLNTGLLNTGIVLFAHRAVGAGRDRVRVDRLIRRLRAPAPRTPPRLRLPVAHRRHCRRTLPNTDERGLVLPQQAERGGGARATRARSRPVLATYVLRQGPLDRDESDGHRAAARRVGNRVRNAGQGGDAALLRRRRRHRVVRLGNAGRRKHTGRAGERVRGQHREGRVPSRSPVPPPSRPPEPPEEVLRHAGGLQFRTLIRRKPRPGGRGLNAPPHPLGRTATLARPLQRTTLTRSLVPTSGRKSKSLLPPPRNRSPYRSASLAPSGPSPPPPRVPLSSPPA